jgi:hypothetical protein
MALVEIGTISCWERLLGPWLTSDWLGSQRRAPQFCHRASGPAEFPDFELFLLDSLRQFDAADRHGRVAEPFESKRWSDALFDSTVILFHQIVQVLAAAHAHALRQLAAVF